MFGNTLGSPVLKNPSFYTVFYSALGEYMQMGKNPMMVNEEACIGFCCEKLEKEGFRVTVDNIDFIKKEVRERYAPRLNNLKDY